MNATTHRVASPDAHASGSAADETVQRYGDYRDSHLGKGDDYHQLFSDNPYASLLWEMERRALEGIVGRHPRVGALRHLDFACGTGRILGFLASHARESVGVDVSASMQAVARRNVPEARFVLGDITSAPLLAREEFDLITAFRFFLNAEPALRSAAMRKLASMMAPGARLVFNNHRNAGSLSHRLLLARRRDRTDLHYLARGEVDDLVRGAGLQVLEIHHLGVLPATEQRMPLPALLMRPIERLASGLGALRWLANDIIYVCARR